MRPVTLDDRLGTRVLVHENGRITAGTVVGMRQAEEAELRVSVALEEVRAGEARRITIPASEAIVDTVGLHQLATTQTSILFLREDLERHKQRVEVLTRERDEALADLAESRRAFETAVDDQQIEDASTAEKIATLTRERDEARAEVERLLTHGDLEDELHQALSKADVPDHFVDPWDEANTSDRMSVQERIEALIKERDDARAEAERLRGALEGLMLSRDASWTGGHDWEEALEAAAAALAWEGEARDGRCCSCGDASAGAEETPCAARDDETHCSHWFDVEEGPAPEVPDMGPQVVDVPAPVHATKENDDCAEWCGACAVEARARAEAGKGARDA